jgi:alkylation response protein AidB-like acyl-CoA dehydrogenase
VISYGPTEEQEVIRDAMREFAEQVLRSAARDADEESALPDGFLDQVWELGLTNTQLPDFAGGGGEARSPVTNALILEELAYGDVALALAAVSPSLFAFPVADFGTEAQQTKYLPAFCGEKFHAASLALIEPSPTFDVLDLQTTAEPKDDGFVLSGRKSFVVLGDRAEHFLVLARNSNAAGTGFDAIDAFIVPRDATGVSVGEVELNLGMKGLPTVGLELQRVDVPAEDRLGEEAGIDARRLIAGTRTAQSALLVGLTRSVLEYCIPYAKDRHAFGEAIAQKQAIAFMLSDMCMETDAMRWLTWKAASYLEAGLDATRESVFASRYTAEHAMRIADNGVQVLGGHGFIRDNPVEMWYRHARTLSVLEGVVAV